MDKKQRLLELLNTIFDRNGIEAKGPELMFYCPFCDHHKRKLQVNCDTQQWHCWVCGAKGRSIFVLAKKLKAPKQIYSELGDVLGLKQTYNSNDRLKTIGRLPKQFQFLFDTSDGIMRNQALKYLESRGISKYDIIRYNIGFCVDGEYGGRIIVPSYDADGNLNYFVGRSIYEGKMKYKNPPVSKNIIVFESNVNWSLPIILCEGVFDAIAIKRNAIPLLGKTVSEMLMSRLVSERVRDVVIALDPDALSTAVSISQRLMRYGIKVRNTNLEHGDPSDLGYKTMLTKIDEAQPLDSYSLILQKIASGSI
jgi:DNA primase